VIQLYFFTRIIVFIMIWLIIFPNMPKNFKREASPNPSKGGEQENNLSVDNQGLEPYFCSRPALPVFQYFTFWTHLPVWVW